MVFGRMSFIGKKLGAVMESRTTSRCYKWKQAAIRDLDMVRATGIWAIARLWISKGILVCGIEGLTDPKIRLPYRMRKTLERGV